jgi:hypothetical protein
MPDVTASGVCLPGRSRVVNVHYVLTADASAVWACINGGGNHPKAGNKETVAGPVSAEDTFNSGKNGNVTASLTAGPLPPSSELHCGSGQKQQLASVTYSNIVAH